MVLRRISYLLRSLCTLFADAIICFKRRFLQVINFCARLISKVFDLFELILRKELIEYYFIDF